MTIPTTDGRARKVGKNQYKIIKMLHECGANGATTKEIQSATGIELRSVQAIMVRLGERGLAQKFALRKNKNRWYYSENADTYLTHWPKFPPHADASSR
tara:strand:- start:1392 stop:1688 length:297 start_codon:yes stop_codon:yes gene_type:complete